MDSRARLRELRALGAELKEYDELLELIWERSGGGGGWFAVATTPERKRVAELQESIALRYGRVRTSVIAAHGSIPVIGNAYSTGGEAIPLAIADPADNPWLSSAIPMSRELITRTVGHYESAGDTWIERTSLIFWVRQAAGPVTFVLGQLKDFGASVVAKILKP